MCDIKVDGSMPESLNVKVKSEYVEPDIKVEKVGYDNDSEATEIDMWRKEWIRLWQSEPPPEIMNNPLQILKECGPLRCNICSVDYTRGIPASHLLGKRHKKSVAYHCSKGSLKAWLLKLPKLGFLSFPSLAP